MTYFICKSNLARVLLASLGGIMENFKVGILTTKMGVSADFGDNFFENFFELGVPSGSQGGHKGVMVKKKFVDFFPF